MCLTVKPVGEPDALIGHVRFDERGWETERCRMAQATAPILDSTKPSFAALQRHGSYRGESGRVAHIAKQARLTQTRHCKVCLYLIASYRDQSAYVRTECAVSAPVRPAACCNSRRNSSRFSCTEAMTSPGASPNPISAASDNCKLASMVSGTASVTPIA